MSQLNQFAKSALKCRLVEEKLLELFKNGHLSGTVHTSVGQEITPVILNQYLNPSDYKFSNHRGHSHYIACTNDIHGLVCELLGKKDGCAGGYGGSQHLYNKAHNFYSNGIQGGMTPIAAGVALSKKLKNEDAISCIYIGDGTLGQGVLYESLNLCGILELPVLFICEDNGIAQSTDTAAFKLHNLKARISGFGCEYVESDSGDWEHLNATLKDAVERARGSKPIFVRVKTRRLNSHSKGDDNRDAEYLKTIRESDILSSLLKSNTDLNEFRDSFAEELDAIVHSCLDLEDLDVVDRFNFIKIESFDKSELEETNVSVRDSLNSMLKQILEADGVVIGEDIRDTNGSNSGQYGGAFKVTQGLSSLFNNRVINTTIAEQAIVGITTGLALDRSTSVAEIMFGDFMTLTVDQVYQHISKFRVMFGEPIPLPLIIRTPMGGRRGYGPTHSQSIERLFLGLPGVIVSAISKYTPIEEIYNYSIAEGIPHISFEHKLNYSSKKRKSLEGSYSYSISDDYSRTSIITPVNDMPTSTIFTYGYGVELIEEYIKTHELNVEIISPSIISPLNILPLLKSLIKTKRLFILEEGSDTFGVASAIVLELKKHRIEFELLGSFGNNNVIPASSVAENQLLNSYVDELQRANL